MKNVLKRFLLSIINRNRKLKFVYFKMATFFATHGIQPPFANSEFTAKKRWETQGEKDSSVLPETYLEEDNSLTELFKDVLPYLPKESSILEIGCNSGRSLNYLYNLGYSNLTGIEIGAKAVELMKKTFPEMYAKSKIIIGDALAEIIKLPPAHFDLVFCHSVLVNIHPKSNRLFREMARVCKKFILTLENEGSYNAYPRDFKNMFEKHNYKMIVSKIYTGDRCILPATFEEKDIYASNTIRLFVKNNSGLMA